LECAGALAVVPADLLFFLGIRSFSKSIFFEKDDDNDGGGGGGDGGCSEKVCDGREVLYKKKNNTHSLSRAHASVTVIPQWLHKK
jgi:hypothetical protein